MLTQRRRATYARVGRVLSRALILVVAILTVLLISWITLVSLAKSYETFCRVREGPAEMAVRIVDVDYLGRQVTCEFAADGAVYDKVFPDAKAFVIIAILIVVDLAIAGAVTVFLLYDPGRESPSVGSPRAAD